MISDYSPQPWIDQGSFPCRAVATNSISLIQKTASFFLTSISLNMYVASLILFQSRSLTSNYIFFSFFVDHCDHYSLPPMHWFLKSTSLQGINLTVGSLTSASFGIVFWSFWSWTYSLNTFKWHKSNIKNLWMKSSEFEFIFLPAFYLIIWLMTSPKNFEKISILKIWQLVFFWGVKIYFGKFLIKWCILRHGKI